MNKNKASALQGTQVFLGTTGVGGIQRKDEKLFFIALSASLNSIVGYLTYQECTQQGIKFSYNNKDFFTLDYYNKTLTLETESDITDIKYLEGNLGRDITTCRSYIVANVAGNNVV